MSLSGDFMLQSVLSLYNQNNEYDNERQRLSRYAKKGKLTRLIRGLYETEENPGGLWLANAIYGPSYLSFEFALSYHGLIPERVYEYCSATFGTGKWKEFITPFGRFSYRDIPKKAYPYGIILLTQDGYSAQIATAEKAMCDILYEKPLLKNLHEMEEFLFEDMRIYENGFSSLSCEDIMDLAPLYGSTNVSLLAKYVRRKL